MAADRTGNGNHGRLGACDSTDSGDPAWVQSTAPVSALITGVAVPRVEEEALPVSDSALWLCQNYPNPFNPETRISYILSQNAKVRLSVYNMLGQEVKVLVGGLQSAGIHAQFWDGRDNDGRLASAGVYFSVLRSGGQHASRRMLMVQ